MHGCNIDVGWNCLVSLSSINKATSCHCMWPSSVIISQHNKHYVFWAQWKLHVRLYESLKNVKLRQCEVRLLSILYHCRSDSVEGIHCPPQSLPSCTVSTCNRAKKRDQGYHRKGILREKGKKRKKLSPFIVLKLSYSLMAHLTKMGLKHIHFSFKLLS